MKKMIVPFYVLLWDFNKKEIEQFDVMEPLLKGLKEEKKRGYRLFCDNKKPETFDEYKKFILSYCQYRFWSKCEYEILVNGFPPNGESKKIDAFYQIKMNIDIITQHFIMQLR